MNAFIKYYMDKAGLHLVANEYDELMLVALEDSKLSDPETALNTFAESIVRHCAEVAFYNDFDPYAGILKEFKIQEVIEEPNYESSWVRKIVMGRIK